MNTTENDAPEFTAIEVDKATDLQINWLVAKCEGYRMGVLTVPEILARQLEGETDPQRIEATKQLFADATAEICFIGESGRKHKSSMEMYGQTGLGTPNYVDRWEQAGPILGRLVRDGFKLESATFSDQFMCMKSTGDTLISGFGSTANRAVMRAFIVQQMGPNPEVPTALAQVPEVVPQVENPRPVKSAKP